MTSWPVRNAADVAVASEVGSRFLARVILKSSQIPPSTDASRGISYESRQLKGDCCAHLSNQRLSENAATC